MVNKTGLEWLRARMSDLGYSSLQVTADHMGLNRGNLWRYFHHDTMPNMGLLPIMCEVLKCTPTELLKALKILGPRQTL
jgi:hypothetical protein